MMNIFSLLTAVSSTDVSRMDLFYQALSISGKGLIGIFIVTIVIILMVALLNKITSKKKKEDK